MRALSAVERALASLEKQFGDGAIVRLDSSDRWSKVSEGISTRSLMIDFAIGRPGVPLGRVTEIVGLEASSKSTLATHLMAEAQRMGGVAILVDSEHATDLERMQRLGVDPERVVLLQPDTLEESFDLLEGTMVKLAKGKVSPICAVYDTVAGMQSAAEEADGHDGQHMGIHARVMSKSLRKLTPLIAKHQIALVFVNQLKEQIGVYMPHGQKKYRSLGGHAIEYHASLRMEVRSREVEREGKGDDAVATGVWVQVKVIKNKVAPPLRTATCFVDYKRGYSQVRDTLRAAMRVGIVQKSGSGRLSIGDRPFAMHSWKDVAKKIGVKKLREEIMTKAFAQGIMEPWSV